MLGWNASSNSAACLPSAFCPPWMTKPWDDAVPRRIGVEAVVGEVDEVFDIDAGDVVVEIGLYVALVGFDGHGVRRVGVVCATAATIAAACAEERDRGSTCN